MTCHRRTALLAALACALIAPAARATPVPIQAVRWELDTTDRHGTWVDNLGQSCVGIRPVDWSGASSRADYRKHIIRYVEFPPVGSSGSFDGVARGGTVTENQVAFEFSRVVKPFTAIDLENVGIEMTAGRAYLTGSFTKPKSYISAARRVRLAVIAHPKLLSGAELDRKHRPIANTFALAIQGSATIGPGLAAALNGFRCKRPVGVLRPRPIRTGASLGFLTLQMLPAGAAGVGGTVDLAGMQFQTDTGDNPAIRPVAPSTSVHVGGEPALRMQLASDDRTALDCQFGTRCIPTAGAMLRIADGGFTVALGGRSVTVDSLGAAYGGEPIGAEVTASVNGQPMTIFSHGFEATSDFLSALSSALGVTFTDGSVHFEPTFTSTAPL